MKGKGKTMDRVQTIAMQAVYKSKPKKEEAFELIKVLATMCEFDKEIFEIFVSLYAYFLPASK